MQIQIHLYQLSKFYFRNKISKQKKNLFFFRIKEHKLNEMEEDLSCQKIFDMTIELKDTSIIFPENGFYQK